jgi:hypothetical protein
MKTDAAEAEFEKVLAQRALDRTRLTAEQGVPAMLAFYRDERAEGCRFERDADMLLGSWRILRPQHHTPANPREHR